MVTEGVNYPVETRRWDDLASTKITLDKGIKLKTIQLRTLGPGRETECGMEGT
jgi:hypothetical protein